MKSSEVVQSCPTLCDLMEGNLPGSSVHGIFQARILEWVAISFSRGSFRCRDRTRVSRAAGRLCRQANWTCGWTEKERDIYIVSSISAQMLTNDKGEALFHTGGALELLMAPQSCRTLRPYGLQPTGLLCPWESPGKDTGVGCHALLQGAL